MGYLAYIVENTESFCSSLEYSWWLARLQNIAMDYIAGLILIDLFTKLLGEDP